MLWEEASNNDIKINQEEKEIKKTCLLGFFDQNHFFVVANAQKRASKIILDYTLDILCKWPLDKAFINYIMKKCNFHKHFNQSTIPAH